VSASERQRRVWALFRQARELPAEERDDFLRKACGDDRELFDEVAALVHSAPPEDFLAEGPESLFTEGQGSDGDDPLLGTRLGDFQIEAVVGEGGMGKVYRARETGALDRPVAIKVVRRGIDTDHVLQRFGLEQATLARLVHPALATVHRAGVTGDGRPWFAMEFVDGRPLTEHCRAEDTPLDRRLGLFIELCSAVQHIHQKGFIHRDLKPSNILVRREDGAIKLIDFGIARALDTGPDAGLTRHERAPGTPAYMSPEQIDETGDADTRSDIYALGVVLYELLTDELPFGRLQGRELTEAIRTRDPQTPSRRLAERDNTVAARHPGWRSRLKGDFDWIVLKALARDRERRYPTAAALADDLQRALEHRPIMARAPSRAYLAGRFVRRHPVAVSASLLGVGVLAALSVSLWWRGQQLKAALAQATTERERAEQVSTFMLETFSAADPHENPGAELTARELLDQGRTRLAESALEPQVEARLLLTMANTYRRLGLFEPSRQAAEAALASVPETSTRDARELRAEILTSLATLARDRSDYAASAEHARRALELQHALHGERSLPVANSTAALGYALAKLGDFDAAEPLLEQAVALHRALGSESEEIVPFEQLASLYVDQGRFDEAKALYRQSLERSRRIHGEQHPETATRENNLAALYYRMGELAEAATHYENALAVQRELLDPLHPNLLTVQNNLGALYNRLGDHDRAAAILEPTLAARREVLGEQHLEVAVTGYHLANALRGLQRHEAAEAQYRQAIDTMRRAAGERDRRVGVLLNGLAEFRLERGALDAARASVEEALAINLEAWPEGHRTTAHSRLIAARVGVAQGRLVEAESLARAALAVLDASPGAETQAALAAGTLGEALIRLGRSDESGPLIDRAIVGLASDEERHAARLDHYRSLRSPSPDGGESRPQP
jgi:tetratricopeptide (TPR) repeat protein/predicted Ser/Thr protein kinase